MKNNFISYSQHADDYIAWQLLGKKKEGLVIEVGAFDGIHLSNSYSFSQLGWKSICIEPNPEIFEYLKLNRLNSININKAIVGDENIKEIDFYKEEIGVLSGCKYDEDDIKSRYKNRGISYKEPDKLKVKAITLNALFEEFNLDEIDVLSIDVEGFELEVLKGLNLNRYNVNLFIIEANTIIEKQKILNYFKNKTNYIYVGENKQNLFFLRDVYLSKKNIRNLNFDNYIKAKQAHPKDDSLTLNSTPPEFKKTKYILKYEKYFGVI